MAASPNFDEPQFPMLVVNPCPSVQTTPFVRGCQFIGVLDVDHFSTFLLACWLVVGRSGRIVSGRTSCFLLDDRAILLYPVVVPIYLSSRVLDRGGGKLKIWWIRSCVTPTRRPDLKC